MEMWRAINPVKNCPDKINTKYEQISKMDDLFDYNLRMTTFKKREGTETRIGYIFAGV
nr:9159_t:CDS:2 [Entrophospora candida]